AAAAGTFPRGQFFTNGQGNGGNGQGGNGGQGGPGGFAGAGGFTIQGTVSAVTADSVTIKTAAGAELTVSTSGDTTYHQQAAATSGDVKSGSTVLVRVDGFRGRFGGGGPAAGGSAASRVSGAGSAAAGRARRRRRRARRERTRPRPTSPSFRRRSAMHLLVVEDDERLSRALRRLLEEDRHVVDVAFDGETGLAIAEDGAGIEAVILDIGLPDISGLEVARRLRRKRSELAILMLTARDTVDDRVTGLGSGADAYLVKPFAYEELAARLRALSRRAASPSRATSELTVGPISLDDTPRRVRAGGREVDLSPREFSLLECLLRHPGQTLTRDQLLDQAWPFSVAVTPNAVDAYIHYLRTKLGAEGSRIETVRGVGYRLSDA